MNRWKKLVIATTVLVCLIGLGLVTVGVVSNPPNDSKFCYSASFFHDCSTKV